LDSGSDGDLLFQKKRQKDSVPYYPRNIPQIWHTSNGIFCTENQGDMELVFPEFSDLKRGYLNPDIAEFNSDKSSPMFDLIIGTETMAELGIILDFKTKMVTLDEQTLPMLRIKNLQTQKD